MRAPARRAAGSGRSGSTITSERQPPRLPGPASARLRGRTRRHRRSCRHAAGRRTTCPPGGASPRRRARVGYSRVRSSGSEPSADELEEDGGDVVVAAARGSPPGSGRARRREVGPEAGDDLLDRRRRRRTTTGRRCRAGRRRRARGSSENVSTSTSGSVPSARVITERCGWTSASAGDSSPRRTSSATSEWSSVELLEPAAAQQVRARVADVAERNRAVGSTRATVIVVPMPEAAASLVARSWTRRFASRTSWRRAASPPRVRRWLSRSAAAARPEATSPACAPPMPSATANSGGAQTKASSLRRRLRPVSVSPAAWPSLTSRSCVEPQVGLADPDDVAGRRGGARASAGSR